MQPDQLPTQLAHFGQQLRISRRQHPRKTGAKLLGIALAIGRRVEQGVDIAEQGFRRDRLAQPLR